MLVARSLSCSIRDVQCTTQAHMLHARTDRDVCVLGSRSSVCVRDRTIHIPSMFAHERSSSFFCSHSSLWTLLSLFQSSSSSSTSATSQVTLPIKKHRDDPQNEEKGSVAKTTSSKGYEPNEIDNFDYSETYTAIFENESVDRDKEPSYSFDAELDDELIRKAPSGARRTGEPETNLSLS